MSSAFFSANQTRKITNSGTIAGGLPTASTVTIYTVPTNRYAKVRVLNSASVNAVRFVFASGASFDLGAFGSANPFTYLVEYTLPAGAQVEVATAGGTPNCRMAYVEIGNSPS